jgi:hypothetical protein
MSYKELSIIEFLDSISENRELQGIDSIIFEDYVKEYLKNRTLNYSKDIFDDVIKYIRDYAKHIEIELYDRDDDTDKLHKAARCNYKIIGQLRPAMKFEFNDNDSLRKRIEFVISNPLLKLNFDYKKLFEFSDIAEREYKRVTESKGTPQLKSPPHFPYKISKEKISTLYTLLLEGGYLSIDETEANFKSFNFIFSHGKEEDFKPVKWGSTKSLLSYFVDCLCQKYIKHDARTSWKWAEVGFGVSGLRGAKNDIEKTGQLPIGSDEIDTILKKI